jgi:hypothetical protein
MADDWTTTWTITPSTITRLVGEQHPLGVGEWRVRLPSLWRLTRASARHAHQVTERYARYFRREFGYDFVQYDADEAYDLHETQAWLWTSCDYEGYRVLGACCCRYRRYTNLPESLWALQWVWLHPYARHKGLFTAAWPVLLQQYGALHLEPPVSGAIRHIVRETPTTTRVTTEGHAVVLHGGTGPCHEGQPRAQEVPAHEHTEASRPHHHCDAAR